MVIAFSQEVATLQLPISAAPRTRSGWSMASRSATQPPIECPATRTDVEPEVVEQTERVAHHFVTEYGGGGDDDGSTPRLSKVTTW